MTAAVSIRKAVRSDLYAILQIERGNPKAAHWSSAEYERMFQDPQGSRLVLIATTVGEILGFVVAREVAPEWELENIAVAEKAQGQGIGSALMEALSQHIRGAGGTTLMLEVRESNKRARRLYEKAGMKLSGRRKTYYADPPEDALLFEKKLTEVSMKIR
jgi:ribosomal-protein-alanine N-acetyltransferase